MASDISIILLSLRVALVATAITLPLAMATAWLLVRRNPRGRIVIEVLVSMPLALPPVVIGFGLLWIFSPTGVLGGAIDGIFGRDVVFTWVAGALAAAIVSFPLVVRTFIVALEGVDIRLEAAARSLGAGPWRTFYTVTVPLAYRGLIAGSLLGFVRALSEFGATIVVAGNIPGQTQTLPLGIFTRLQAGDDDLAIRLIVISVLLAVGSLLVHNYLLSRARTGERDRNSARLGAI
ncbi:MAG: molybdate ABC transporter permease subunit [Chloroflexi bacterium]|nr:molybdate ABC transporter permease subunit [Chloroflexota bacterium]